METRLMLLAVATALAMPIGAGSTQSAGGGLLVTPDNVTRAKNDGTTTYKLNVPGNVPVDAFWSVIVYDETGHLQKNQYDAYSLNSVTAKSNTDGSVAVQCRRLRWHPCGHPCRQRVC